MRVRESHRIALDAERALLRPLCRQNLSGAGLVYCCIVNMRLLTRLVGAVAGMALFATPTAAQQQTDIIRGRVLGPDTLPIQGARVTATSYQGSITKSAATDKNGRFQIIFVNGEGDYWIEVAKIGFNRRRFEIKKVGDEQVMLADARLTSAVAQLDAVVIKSDNRALVNRNSRTPDVSGGDKPLSSTSPLLPPDQAGNLAAMASTTPGVQLVPGMDGAADMFSALGLSGDQNNTTFNGLGSGVSSLPPDAQVRITFNQFPADPARGGFSGAQINVASIPGSNFSFRALSGYGTGPDLEWTDQGADSSGQKSTTLRVGGNLRGPIQMDQAFYNASYSAQRNFADMLTLLNTSPVGLQSAGVASDSAARLLGILRNKQVPVSLANGPSCSSDRQFELPGELRLHAQLVGHGQFAHARRVRRVRARPADGRRRPTADENSGADRRSARLFHVGLAPALELLRVRRPFTDHARARGLAAIPKSIPGLSHGHRSGRVEPARRLDLDQVALVRRRQPAQRRGESDGAAPEPTPMVQRQQQAHHQDHVERVARAHRLRRERITGIVLVQFARRSRGRSAGVVHAHIVLDSFSERSGHGGRVGR